MFENKCRYLSHTVARCILPLSVAPSRRLPYAVFDRERDSSGVKSNDTEIKRVSGR